MAQSRQANFPDKTTPEWVAECKYISDVTDKRGNVGEMMYSKDVFITYCTMQRNAADKYGRDDVVQYIQHCIDDLEG